MTAGSQLRMIREKLGFTLRHVEAASQAIAAKLDNEEFIVSFTRLSDIESKAVLPSIYKLFSLAVIYKRDYTELLTLFGIELERSIDLASLSPAPQTHRLERTALPETVKVPVKIEQSFDIRKTTTMGMMISQWGTVPLTMLETLTSDEHLYGYVGTEDFTMYPLLLPGSFIQVDQARDKVVAGVWASELERPIYFVEARDGFRCCWCSLDGNSIILQPHPLSPVLPKTLRYPQEAEVIGQVVGVAMRLDRWSFQPDAMQRKRQQLT